MKELLNILPDRQLSLSEFVDLIDTELRDFILTQEKFEAVSDYNNFLKQPLELRMQHPCNDKGEQIYTPQRQWYFEPKNSRDGQTITEFNLKEYNEDVEKYNKASDRVLYSRGSGITSFGGDLSKMEDEEVSTQFWKEALGL